MTIASMDYPPDRGGLRATPVLDYRRLACSRFLRVSMTKFRLIFLSTLLFCASIAIFSLPVSFLAGQNRNGCTWYTVETGDTLTNIAMQYHTTISRIARANAISNFNLIFVGQRICVPSHRGSNAAGVMVNGTVRWYAYDALAWSNRPQVHHMLYHLAALHHLPVKLLLAIAWQESGWTQHVIAWDGGIGVMQLMPYTAMEINAGTGQQLDPYTLGDNLTLGATYLQWLWQDFHGNLAEVISAYNEGGWAVIHRGIFNWQYVNNVLALMNDLN